MDSSPLDSSTDSGDTAPEADAGGDADAATDTTTPDGGVLPDGLILHLPFDESGGTVVRDVVSGRDLGTIEGGASFEAGVLGNSLRFDAMDDRVVILNDAPIAVGRRFTVALWLNPDTATQNGVLFNCAGDPHLLLRLDAADRGTVDAISARPDEGDWPSFVAWFGLDQITAGAWQHLAFTAHDGELRVYLDGAEVASRSVDMHGAEDGSDPECYVSGAHWSHLNDLYAGAIDDVRLYDRGISPAEVSLLASTR